MSSALFNHHLLHQHHFQPVFDHLRHHLLSQPPLSNHTPFQSQASTEIELEGVDSVTSSGFSFSRTISSLSSQNSVEHWPRILTLIGGIAIILLIGLLAALYFIPLKRNSNLTCQISFTVSKDRTSDFSTVSEAVEASPSHSPCKICILIRAGEYHEIVSVGDEKINLMLMGERTGKTRISSNASIKGHVTIWPQATLSVKGKYFLAQDITIINTAKNGIAVENLGENSVFFRCTFEGANTTQRLKGKTQFYRSCIFYGKSSLVHGFAQAFFQTCEFFCHKLNPLEKTVFFSQSTPLSTYKSVFIFHLCSFHVAEKFVNSSEVAFLGGYFGDYTSIAVMQSSLDASIGGYFLGSSPPSTIHYAIFRNIRHGSPLTNIPPFIHTLSNVEVASEFSLREFLGGRHWMPPVVEYDLDLAK